MGGREGERGWTATIQLAHSGGGGGAADAYGGVEETNLFIIIVLPGESDGTQLPPRSAYYIVRMCVYNVIHGRTVFLDTFHSSGDSSTGL